MIGFKLKGMAVLLRGIGGRTAPDVHPPAAPNPGGAVPFDAKRSKLGAIAPLCLCLFGSSALLAQMVTNHPVEAPGPLSNPLMGFRPNIGSKFSRAPYYYPTLVRHYIRWNQIENSESDTVQKIRDFCNAQWANLPTNNLKVIPRVYLDWDSNPNNEYWPADLQSGDWTSQQFKDRVVRLIGRLGEVWDNDPRVAWVQMGIIGYWGEQEKPVGIDEDGWTNRLGEAFNAAFHHKKILVRNIAQWPGYEFGLYWDSFGHPSQQSQWNGFRSLINAGRHLTQVIEGEVAYNWGTDTFDPQYGGEPEITLNNTNYTDNMIDVIRELHASALGWIASYELDGRYGTDPNTIKANAARMQKAFGYRFHITEFACSARTEPGANLEVRFKVQNLGSAPFYENWPVAVVLVNETNRQMVWKATLPNVDIRTWRPGDNYSYTNRTYLTPAEEHQISASVPVPTGLAPGQYLVGLSILEPLSRTPGIFFALTNFFKQSQSQPLCRIGIGVNVGTHTLTGVAFDDLVNDDARYYTLTPQGPTYALTVQSSSEGSVSLSPAGGSYVKDTGVEVMAKGNLGYGFSSWGGALAGLTNNPAIIVMDANKTLSANFIPVPTYTLTTSATNGALALSPPGGVYNAGTAVTLTASPNRGYDFGSWSGALAGTTNPATIVMDGNKSVTANFTVFDGDVAPWLETFTLPDGAKSNGPPTTWTATRSSGLFQASGNRFMINQGSAEGVLETAEISIAGGSVKVSLEVQAAGGLEAGDYVKFYRIVDGGPAVQIGQTITGLFTGTNTLVATNLSGSRLKLRIVAKVSASDEYYYFDNLKVEDEVPPPTYTLTSSATNGSIALNPPGGVYPTGTVVTVTATPNAGYTFSHWSGDLSGTNNPATLTMTGNKTVTANFTLLPAVRTALFVLSGTATNASDAFLANRLATHFGFEVQLCGAPTLTTDTALSNAADKALIMISSTISSGDLVAWARRFMTNLLTVPVITWEYGNADEWGFSTAGGSGNATSTLLITNAPNGLTAGLTNGIHPVYTAAGNDGTQFTGPNPGVLVAAANPTTGSIRIAGMPVGMELPNYLGLGVTVTNASRKVFLGLLGNNQADNLNTNGLALFDAAVRWATGQAAPIRFEPPVVEGEQLRLEWVGEGTLQSATTVLGPWDDVPQATSPYLSPMTNAAQFFRVKQ